jgi:hypothetical protein
LFALLLSAAALTAHAIASGADKPKENAENSGAPDVSYPLDEFSAWGGGWGRISRFEKLL